MPRAVLRTTDCAVTSAARDDTRRFAAPTRSTAGRCGCADRVLREENHQRRSIFQGALEPQTHSPCRRAPRRSSRCRTRRRSVLRQLEHTIHSAMPPRVALIVPVPARGTHCCPAFAADACRSPRARVGVALGDEVANQVAARAVRTVVERQGPVRGAGLTRRSVSRNRGNDR